MNWGLVVLSVVFVLLLVLGVIYYALNKKPTITTYSSGFNDKKWGW